MTRRYHVVAFVTVAGSVSGSARSYSMVCGLHVLPTPGLPGKDDDLGTVGPGTEQLYGVS